MNADYEISIVDCYAPPSRAEVSRRRVLLQGLTLDYGSGGRNFWLRHAACRAARPVMPPSLHRHPFSVRRVLSTGVGVLVEAPVMLSIVYIVRRSPGKYEADIAT